MRIPKVTPKTLTLVLSAATLSLLIIFALAITLINSPSQVEPEYGITFSTVYAQQLGLNPQETYRALLTDLGIKKVRLPIYWDVVEPNKNDYAWEEIDWIFELSEIHDVKLTVVIGQKVPRWPECFIPDWVERIDVEYQQEELLEFMALVVERYKDSPALERWQIENEAFFPFGVCPTPNLKRFSKEVELVRSLDDHPIQITVSGELEPYFDAALPADVLGISMYRVTWNNFIGFWTYPITPLFYRAKSVVVYPFVDHVVISELQAEPWFPEPIDKREPKEWYKSFDAGDMRKNIEFAKRTGIDEVYLWGAEWWYFLRVNGENRLWEVAEEIF